MTYTTIGYGDLVLPKEWRLFGPVEGLTGILMCGLSTAFLFATLGRMYATRTKTGQIVNQDTDQQHSERK